jgi:hypothetical protein
MRFLLVAKPWKGGLAKYIFKTLDDVFPGNVRWITTYPDSTDDYIHYRKNKSAWQTNLIYQINQADYDIAIFINHLNIFKSLRTDKRNILWMTDAPTIKQGEDLPYERIFISDLGYEKPLLERINNERYAGELAFACYPKIHYPVATTSLKRNVCFIGNKDECRDEWLSYLLKNNTQLDIYGNYFLRTKLFWQHPTLVHPSISNTLMQSVYTKHHLSINIHAKVVCHGTNMRTFECAAYGIPQVVDYRPGLSDFFDQSSILTSKIPDEMLKQIQHLLMYPEEAAKIAANARQLVLSKHTYYHRILQATQGWLTPAAEYKLQQACISGYPQDASCR